MTNPYVIVAPAYRRTSAGVRALHLLCHSLRQRGALAFVTTTSAGPGLDTPAAGRDLFAAWHRERVTPIVVYPEKITDNPLGSDCVVRYLLNYPGHLGGEKRAHPGDFYVSFAKGMNPWVDRNQEKVLQVPLVDTGIFHPPATQAPRRGSCYYAVKYKGVHRGKTFPITDGSIEITRGRPDSQTQEEIADLFRRSEFFYTYENTALALEARLCGCPVILLRNPHFDEVIATEELGTDGIAATTDPGDVARAVATVGRVVERYAGAVRTFGTQLDEFIDATQTIASTRGQKQRLDAGYIEAANAVWPSRFPARAFARTYVVFRSLVDPGRRERLAELKAHARRDGFRRGFRQWTKSMYGRRGHDPVLRCLGLTLQAPPPHDR